MTKQQKARKLVKDLGFDSVEEVIAILQSMSEDSADVKQQPTVKVVNIEEESELSLEIKVKRMLRRMRAPANLKGYQYLVDAIVKGLKDKESLDSITNILYPYVADKNKTTGSRVERAIRHFIEVLYERGEYKEVEKVVGNSVNPNKGKLTNSEFICAFVDYILMGGE